MTLTELTNKIAWFLKPENKHRINEPFRDTTLYNHLCQVVEDYFEEQPPERFETEEWKIETEEIMRRCGRIETNGKD